MHVIEAIILAGGFGTRLREVVSEVPKPMAPIGDKPFLSYLLDRLETQGVERVILSVGYMSEKIIGYFGDRYKSIEIIYAIEERPLGTGGAVKKCLEYCLNSEIYVMNGDTYSEINLKGMKLLRENSKDIVLGAIKVDDISRYGSIKIDNGLLEAFNEKGLNGVGWINVGTYLIDKNIFDGYNFQEKFSFEENFLQKFYKKNRVKVYTDCVRFIDIGIPEDYIYSCEHFFK